MAVKTLVIAVKISSNGGKRKVKRLIKKG